MPHGKDIQNPKLRGEWAELRFMQCATERGFRCNKPWGEAAPYDVAIACPEERQRRMGPPRPLSPRLTHGLRRGLYSLAAPRLPQHFSL
jgi:hypothetical protein